MIGSIRRLNPKDPNSPWVFEYTDPRNNKRRRVTPKSGLKKDAQAIAQKINSELMQGTHIARSQTVTFGQAASDYLADCDRRHRIGDHMAGGTLNKYKTLLRNHLLPTLSARKMTEVTFRDVQDLINLKCNTLKAGSVENISIVVQQVFKFAVDRGWLSLNPLKTKTLRIPNKRRVEKRIPSKDELRRILEAMVTREPGEHHLTHRNRMLMVLLAVFAGLRRGEIGGLQWDDVDLENEVLNVRHSHSFYDGLKAPKSEAGVRTVPLAPPLVSFLTGMRDDLGEKAVGYVLQNNRSGNFTTHDMWFMWRTVMRKADLLNERGSPKYTFHALRHMNVSLLISLGLQPIHIQKLVGHASIKMTMDVYGHLFPDDGSSRQAINAAAAQFDTMRVNPRLPAPASRAGATKPRQDLLTH